MKRNNVTFAALALVLALAVSCGKESRAERGSTSPPPSSIGQTAVAKQAATTPDYGQVLVTNRLDIDFSKYPVTFIELGADRCIPCKQMQPIMKEIAAAFPDRVQVIFYDVWKDSAPAEKYGIQLIPTQVF